MIKDENFIVEFSTDDDIRTYLYYSRQRLKEILKDLDPKYEPSKMYISDNEKICAIKRMIIETFKPITEKEQSYLDEVYKIEINFMRILHYQSWDSTNLICTIPNEKEKGITKIEVKPMPLHPIHEHEPSKINNSSSTTSYDNESANRMERNQRRRANGADYAAGFGPCR